MKANIWVDNDGKVRHAGPFANTERIVSYNPEGYASETNEELATRLLQHYLDNGIPHPLNEA